MEVTSVRCDFVSLSMVLKLKTFKPRVLFCPVFLGRIDLLDRV